MSRFSAGGVGDWLQLLFNADVSRFSAGVVGDWLQSLFTGSVGGWLQSLFNAGVSRFRAGGVGGWLRSHFKAGVSRFSAGLALAGVLVRRVSTICHIAASQHEFGHFLTFLASKYVQSLKLKSDPGVNLSVVKPSQLAALQCNCLFQKI